MSGTAVALPMMIMPPSDRLSIWKEWVRKHADEMAHIADFEAQFVLDVLSKIPEIDPDDLIPQYPFYDAQNKLRRIDFLVLNPEKGFALAIELDGYTKIQSYSDWEDLFVRQNALLESLHCMLLRYANRLWLKDPKRVVAEIRDALRKQVIAHQARQASRRRQKDKDEDLRRLIEENCRVRQEVEELKASLHRFHVAAASGQGSPKPDLGIELASSAALHDMRRKPAFLAVLILSVCLIVFFALRMSSESASMPTNGLGNATGSTSGTQSEADASLFVAAEVAPADVRTSPEDVVGAVPAEKASRHIGEDRTVCGRLAQVADGEKFVFLNFGLKFPDQVFTGIIPVEFLTNFKGINLFIDKEICLKGLIDSYRNHPQILLKDSSQWVR